MEHIDCRYAIRVNIRKENTLAATIIATRSDKPLFYARRKLVKDIVRVEHTYLVIDPGVRQGGLGMQITANALAVYPKMGFKEIQLDAGLTDGGTVWARVGYVPVDRKQWERVKKVVRRNFDAFPHEVRSSATPVFADFREQLNLILKSPNPLFIRQILRLDREGEVRLAGGLSDDVSKLLLRNSRWRGAIHLDQAESIGRAREYVAERFTQGRVLQPEWW